MNALTGMLRHFVALCANMTIKGILLNFEM